MTSHRVSLESLEPSTTSPGSRRPSPSPSSSAALGAKPESWKQGEKRRHQGGHTETSSETHLSANTDDTCDTNDEDPRPARGRKLRLAPAAVAAPLQPPSPSTTSLEAADAQPEVDDECSPASIHNDEQHHASRTARSPSATTDPVPAAEYQKRPFRGFLNRTKIGDDVMYNLEFGLLSFSESLHLPINHEALDNYSGSKKAPPRSRYQDHHRAVAQSTTRHVKSKCLTKRILWTKKENETVVKMKEDGCSWEDIHDALPHRSVGSIQVHYSTKLKW